MSLPLIALQCQLLVLVGRGGGPCPVLKIGLFGDAGDVDAHGRLLGDCQGRVVPIGSVILLDRVHV